MRISLEPGTYSRKKQMTQNSDGAKRQKGHHIKRITVCLLSYLSALWQLVIYCIQITIAADTDTH